MPYAEDIVRSYLNRYATERLIRRPPTERDMALIHQGGPKGWNRTTEKAEDYWAKVGNRLNQGAPGMLLDPWLALDMYSTVCHWGEPHIDDCTYTS